MRDIVLHKQSFISLLLFSTFIVYTVWLDTPTPETWL